LAVSVHYGRIPSNKEVRHIIEVLEVKLYSEARQDRAPMNMGEAMTLLCSPPYGCNIASAGLLLAYFAGSRKNDLQLFQNNEAISIDKWLQNAMPGNFLSLPVLEATTLMQLLREAYLSGRSFLDQWDLETYLGREKRLSCERTRFRQANTYTSAIVLQM